MPMVPSDAIGLNMDFIPGTSIPNLPPPPISFFSRSVHSTARNDIVSGNNHSRTNGTINTDKRMKLMQNDDAVVPNVTTSLPLVYMIENRSSIEFRE